MSAKHKIIIGLAVSVVVLGFFLALWKIAGKPTSKQDRTSNMAAQAARERDVVPSAIKSPAKEISETSDEDIEEFIAFLDELGKAGDSSEEGDSQKTLAVSDETPLSYEEELKQRLRRMDEDPEFKAVNGRIKELRRERDGLDTPRWLRAKLQEYSLNKYSVFGLTREEGMQKVGSGELSQADIAYMHEEGRKLRQQREEYRVRQRANTEERIRLHHKRLEILGMTDREFSIALGRPYTPPPRYFPPPEHDSFRPSSR